MIASIRRAFSTGSVPPAIVDVLLALAVAVVTAFVYLSHYGAALASSSDNVFPYVLFDDVLHRKLPIDGIMWPESPFFFPDGPLAFFAHIATPNLRAAITVFAVVQATLVFLAVRWLCINTLADRNRGRAAWTAWLALLLAMSITGCTAYDSWFGRFDSYIFVPNNHCGGLLGAIAAFALLAAPPGRENVARILFLAAWCGLIAVSDRLFEIQFMLPGIVVALCLYLARRRRWYLAVSGMLAALTLAFEALRHYFPSDLSRHFIEAAKESGKSSGLGGDPFSQIGAAEATHRTLADLKTLLLADPFGAIVMLASVATLIWILLARRSVAAPQSSRWLSSFTADRLLALIVLIAALAPLAAGMILGRHVDMGAFRYCMTALLVPLGLAVAASRVHLQIGIFRIDQRGICAALVLFLIVTAAASNMSRAALSSYDLDQEKCFAAAARAHALKMGVGDYWQGISMLARLPSGPTIAPIDPADAGPRVTMNANLGWFGMTAASAAQLPTLDFVMEHGLKPDQLDAAYGPAVDRVACPASDLRIYRDTDGVLSRMYRHHEWLPNLVLTRVGSITLPAAAWPADPQFIEGDTLHFAGTAARATPVLQTLQEFPAGRIAKIWIEYTLKTTDPRARVSWEVVPLDAQGRSYGPIGEGVLDKSDNASHVEWALQRPRPTGMNGLGIAVHAQGTVDLKILALHIGLDRRF